MIDKLKGKRGKKGGTQFPRYSLKHLSNYLSGLIGKTHTSSITIEQLSSGVFGVGPKSTTGQIKCSALKQYGLLEGNYKKLDSTTLCSEIAMADGEEKMNSFVKALNNVSPFADAFSTFQNSTTDKNKIAQYAVSTLKVHPDMKDDFVKIFIESIEIAGLCTIDGSSITFLQKSESPISDKIPSEKGSENSNNEDSEQEKSAEIPNINIDESGTHSFSTQKQGKSNINVNIDVDPSMDPEKLEKLLKLLKGYGAI